MRGAVGVARAAGVYSSGQTLRPTYRIIIAVRVRIIAIRVRIIATRVRIIATRVRIIAIRVLNPTDRPTDRPAA
jgi:hypothetical protein